MKQKIKSTFNKSLQLKIYSKFDIRIQKQRSQKMKARGQTKLQQFINEHKSLVTQFEESKTLQSKYRIMKKTINLLNPKSIKPVLTKQKTRAEADEFGEETEQGYFRLLGRMCEAQQQMLTKNEQTIKKETKKSEDLSQSKQNIKTHYNRKYQSCSKRLYLHNQSQRRNKKFIEIPDFSEMLTKCSVGFIGHSAQIKVKRHQKKAKKGIYERLQNRMKQSFIVEPQNKKLKKEVQNLKFKAKELYDIDFQFLGKTSEGLNQKNTEKKDGTQQFRSSLSFHDLTTKFEKQFSRKPWQVAEKRNSGSFFQQKRHINVFNDEPNDQIPESLIPNKIRPVSVGMCVAKRQKKLTKKKLGYYRI